MRAQSWSSVYWELQSIQVEPPYTSIVDYNIKKRMQMRNIKVWICLLMSFFTYPLTPPPPQGGPKAHFGTYMTGGFDQRVLRSKCKFHLITTPYRSLDLGKDVPICLEKSYSQAWILGTANCLRSILFISPLCAYIYGFTVWCVSSSHCLVIKSAPDLRQRHPEIGEQSSMRNRHLWKRRLEWSNFMIIVIECYLLTTSHH